MVRTLYVVAIACTGFLLVAGCLGGPTQNDQVGQGDKDPQILSWSSAGAHCTDDFASNVSARTSAGDGSTTISYARNVSMPDPSYSLGHPDLRWNGNHSYRLDVPVERTDKPSTNCTGTATARYNATIQFENSGQPWTVEIHHDGEHVSTMTGDVNSSAASTSVTAGHSVSGSGEAAITDHQNGTQP